MATAGLPLLLPLPASSRWPRPSCCCRPPLPVQSPQPPLPVLCSRCAAAGGDMFEYVVRKGGLRESEARWFFQQLIVAVDYIHRMVRGRGAGGGRGGRRAAGDRCCCRVASTLLPECCWGGGRRPFTQSC